MPTVGLGFTKHAKGHLPVYRDHTMANALKMSNIRQCGVNFIDA